MKKLLLSVAFLLLLAPVASAVPELQIYIEGATYDATLETWITTSGSFKLWVAGDVSAMGTIYDVKLAASMYGTSGSISLTPTTTALVTDPSTPGALGDLGSDETQFEAGGAYESGAFTPVQNHDEYADADFHHFWDMGDFNLTDSPIGDFSDVFPPAGGYPSTGQINVYDVVITGWDQVHWDAFDHTVMTTGHGEKYSYWKVPPSHDGTGGGGVVPEPGTMGLLGLGIMGLALRRRRAVGR